MPSLKVWLMRANGWRRLWFVASLIGIFYCVFINPFVLTSDSQKGQAEYRWAVEREMRREECSPYISKPLSELPEAPYVDQFGTTGCYHLYSQRRYNNPTKVPYTLEDLNSDYRSEIWGPILSIGGVGFLAALILSALAYFSGWVVAWVISGFKGLDKKDSS